MLSAKKKRMLKCRILKSLLRKHKTKWSRGEPEPKGFDSSRYFASGVEGSRTPVQKPIPCPSTIIVRYSGRTFSRLFPPGSDNEQSVPFGSFMVRPRGQSLARVVSHIVDARIPACECPGADKPPKAASPAAIKLQVRTDNYLQRLFLILRLTCRNG